MRPRLARPAGRARPRLWPRWFLGSPRGRGGAETRGRGAQPGGRAARWVGFRPRPACPSDGVVSHLFSPRQHVGRKGRGRAQRPGSAPRPPLRRPGAHRTAAGATPHPGPPSLHPLQGPHPRGSQEGTRSPPVPGPWGAADVPVGPTVCRAWCGARTRTSVRRFWGACPTLKSRCWVQASDMVLRERVLMRVKATSAVFIHYSVCLDTSGEPPRVPQACVVDPGDAHLPWAGGWWVTALRPLAACL